MKRILVGFLAVLVSTSASATIIGSSLSKGEDGTPLINTSVLDQLSGIKPTFPNVTAFNAAVTQERANITNNGVGVWPSGQELGIIGQLGVRQWYVGSSAAASNAWNVLYLGKTYTLAADSNVFIATSGPPSNSTGNNGDYAADGAAGLVYGPKASGVWPAGVSASTVPLGGLAQSGAATNQVIQWNGTAWAPASPSGGISGPGTTVNGYVPAWSGTTGAALSAGLPVGLTGNSTIVETTSGGLLTPSLLPIATTSTLGSIKPDGSTITVNASTGVASAVGGSATSVVVGTTTVGGGTAPCLLENSTGTTMACPAVTAGAVTALGNAPNASGGFVTFSGALGTPTSGTLTNATGLPIAGLAQSGAANNQVPQWNGTTWVPATVAAASSSTASATATGTNQGTAYAITTTTTVFTTVASGTGAILQSTLNTPQVIYNRGANALNVYPALGAQIEAAGANVAVTVGVGSSAIFRCVTTTQCYAGV